MYPFTELEENSEAVDFLNFVWEWNKLDQNSNLTAQNSTETDTNEIPLGRGRGSLVCSQGNPVCIRTAVAS